MKNLNQKFLLSLMKKLPSTINTIQVASGELVIIVPHTLVYQLLFFLKNHTTTQYKILADMTAVDFPEKEKRI